MEEKPSQRPPGPANKSITGILLRSAIDFLLKHTTAVTLMRPNRVKFITEKPAPRQLQNLLFYLMLSRLRQGTLQQKCE
jgi:hypothetical protein